MSYRRKIQSKWEEQRHKYWPQSKRMNTIDYRIQGNPNKYFSKTWSCKKKPHIRLFCPHCYTQCLTFTNYQQHLHADKHLRAMGRRILKVERDIENKRKEQAEAQATADRIAKIEGSASTIVKYCAVCNLNFYQEESKHVATKLHIVLQEMLKPKCNICPYQSKDAVDYENHLCSLAHVKREECWTGEIKEDNIKPPEEVLKSNEGGAEEASTSSKDISELSTSGEAMTTNTESSNEQTKNSNNSSGELEALSVKTALYCNCCNVYFDYEGGQQASEHCNTQQHLEMWVKYIEGKSELQDQSKE